MSRPRSSVPNQCCADGALRTSVQLVAMGSYGESSGAKIASTMNVAMITSPTTAPLRRSSRRSALRAGLSNSSEALIGIAPTMASLMRSIPQPWIDEDIGDIGNQVQRNVDGRGHQHHALHHGIVAVENGIDDQLPKPGNRKYLLRQHGAGQERAEFERGQGDHRRQRVAHGMLENDRAFGKTLGASGPNVVTLKHLQH